MEGHYKIGGVMPIRRSMTIIRMNGELALVNAVRSPWLLSKCFAPSTFLSDSVPADSFAETSVGIQVRVDKKVEKEIENLGEIKHIVRIACGHGSDDPYYITKYRTRVGCSTQHNSTSLFNLPFILRRSKGTIILHMPMGDSQLHVTSPGRSGPTWKPFGNQNSRRTEGPRSRMTSPRAAPPPFTTSS